MSICVTLDGIIRLENEVRYVMHLIEFRDKCFIVLNVITLMYISSLNMDWIQDEIFNYDAIIMTLYIIYMFKYLKVVIGTMGRYSFIELYVLVGLCF